MRAFKFRDPDGHSLELLWLPEGQRRREWRDRSSALEPQAPASSASPGLQHPAYRPVGRVRETSALFDLSTEWTTLGAVMAGGPSPGLIHDTDPGGPPTPLIAVSDPDGHRFVLVSQ
jgi:hypothetical protein